MTTTSANVEMVELTEKLIEDGLIQGVALVSGYQLECLGIAPSDDWIEESVGKVVPLEDYCKYLACLVVSGQGDMDRVRSACRRLRSTDLALVLAEMEYWDVCQDPPLADRTEQTKHTDQLVKQSRMLQAMRERKKPSLELEPYKPNR